MILFKRKIKRNAGFTLIEILAVIIILGILVIIAIPAVTRYIEDSRRSAYIGTARQIIAGARNLVNSGNMDMYNADATYYLPISCIKSENSQKSINGDFTLAYVGVTYNGSGYEYYWTSVDKEGEGIKVLTSYDDLNEDKIESGIKLSDIDTTVSVGGKSITLVYNNDCTEIQENQAHLVVTLDGNDGEFSNGQHTKQLKYPLPINVPEPVVKYSYTSNINDNGEQLTNYNNNWTNANIIGTDRGDTSQAHVVTIPGASSLHVKIIYGGESSSYDWVCMWKGSHPEYTAYNNYSSSITGKLGGGNHTTASNTKEYDVDGDTVTFGFRSDVSVCGDGYGYYAVVTPNYTIDYIGTYEEPKRDDYLFDGWEKDGKTYEKLSNIVPKDNETYDAKWKASSKLIINPNGGYIYVDGVYVSSSTTYTKKAGESLTYSSLGHSSYTYSNGSWTITYNSNGGSTTPASKTAQVYYTCSYTFNNWNLSGDCDNVSSTTSMSSTYTFPDDPGGKCTMSASWTGRCGSNYAYSYTLPAAPTKAGYRFLGWKSSATGAIYPASSTFYPTQSETLTAQWEKSDYTVTFDANGGSFSSGSTSTNVTYTTSVSSQTYKKYSYTQNLNQNGNKSSNYGNNWTNSYIRGTDRTSSNSQAHVVTIPGATDLTIEVYYNGESTSYDWVTLWAGSHPSYTASSYYSYGVTNGQKLGGACYGLSYYVGTSSYYYSNVCKRTFGITGDTVSFGFKSDGSEWGDGFGYYATVSGTVRTITGSPSSSVQTPTRSGYRFTGWKSSLDNQIYTNVNVINNLNSNITMTAQWEQNGGSALSCTAITDTIYWALQDNDSNGTKERLVISSYEVDGALKGSFSGYSAFSSTEEVPWINANSSNTNNSNNLSYRVTEVKTLGNVIPKSTAHWFEYVGAYSYNGSFSADLSHLNVCKTENMSYMFYLTSTSSSTWSIGDISWWDTSKVTDMSYMFSHAGGKSSSVNIGDIGRWNTSSVTNMDSMFSYAFQEKSSLNMDLSGWDTSKVTNMNRMFVFFANKATSFNLNIGSWDVSKVTNMQGMFNNIAASTLTMSLGNITNWNTVSVTNMGYMFYNAFIHVTNFDLDIRNWDTSNVENMSYMFEYTGENSSSFKLDIRNWKMYNVTNLDRFARYTGMDATSWQFIIPRTNGAGTYNSSGWIYGKSPAKNMTYQDRSFTFS